MISIVCPFYNEELIIEGSVKRMLENLGSLPEEWELIVVNDGSKDKSLAIVRELEKDEKRLKVITYVGNRGRGYAIRQGVQVARGDLVITTEIDSSWGDDIVQRIIREFQKHPDADIIVASPHLPGGGYKNVPSSRVFLTTMGNYIIQSGLTYKVTMNTGMTRGYKRAKFLALPLDEDEKEMHLEIINKATAFNYKIYEIPAVIEWQDHKFTQGKGKRKSSANINKLIRTHMLFSILAAPFRYLYVVSALFFLMAAILFIWSFINLVTHNISIYLFLSSLLVGIFGFLIFGIGVLAQQGRALQREMWRIRSELRQNNLSTQTQQQDSSPDSTHLD